MSRQININHVTMAKYTFHLTNSKLINSFRNLFFLYYLICLLCIYCITITEYLHYKAHNTTKIALQFVTFLFYKLSLYITYLQYTTLLKHYLLHTTLPTYKTLHKITELLKICYITYVHRLQYITLPHLLHYVTLFTYNKFYFLLTRITCTRLRNDARYLGKLY